MTAIKIFAGLSLLMTVGFQNVNKEVTRQYVSGIVLDRQNNRPLPDVYVYTIKGEEEAITNRDGKFSFATWQASNLVLYIKHSNKEELQIKVTDLKKILLIRL